MDNIPGKMPQGAVSKTFLTTKNSMFACRPAGRWNVQTKDKQLYS